METYLRFVNRFPRAIIIALLGVTVVLGLQLPKLTMDSNPYLLSEEHPARKSILDMQKEFTGTYDAALIAIYNQKGVFNRDTLDAVLDLSRSAKKIILANADDAGFLEKMATRHAGASSEFAAISRRILEDGLSQGDALDAERLRELGRRLPLNAEEKAFLDYFHRRLNPIKEMASLSASENIVNRDGTLVVQPSLRDSVAPVAQVRSESMSNPLMVGGNVSTDEKVTLVTVELFVKQDDAEGQLRAYDAFRGLVDNYRNGHPEFARNNETFIAGVPIFIAEQKRLMDRDLGTLLPIVIAIVTGVLIMFFRRPLGVVLPLLNVLMAAVWTLGFMAVFHVPMDIITSALPVFLITICGADAIHMMNEYYTQRRSGAAARQAVRNTLSLMVSPVVLTTATTVAGFLFSTSTNISSIVVFGIFMAVGLIGAQIISLLLIPAWLNLFGHLGWKKRDRAASEKSEAQSEEGGKLGEVLVRIFQPVTRHRRVVLGVFSVVLAALALLSTRIHVEDAGSSYFSPKNKFRQADEFVNAHVAGTSPGWITVGGEGARAMLTVENMAFVEKLDEFLMKQPNVTYTYSAARYVKRINQVMHDMDGAYDRLPKKTELVSSTDPDTGLVKQETVNGDDVVSQSILMYENGGGSELRNVLNSDFSKAITLFAMNTTRASEYEALLKSFDRWQKENTPAHLKVAIAGTPVIWSGVLAEIIRGQFISFILAFAAITLVLMLWLRSWRHGLITGLPLACTMVSYYGLMTLFGIDLNIGTAIISFLVVGIVDYSVHYLHRIKHAMFEGRSLDDALIYAIRSSGQSIVFNVMVFSLGFLSLLASEFTPIVYLGALVAMALSISGFMSIFVILLLAPWFIKQSDAAEDAPSLPMEPPAESAA